MDFAYYSQLCLSFTLNWSSMNILLAMLKYRRFLSGVVHGSVGHEGRTMKGVRMTQMTEVNLFESFILYGHFLSAPNPIF